MYVRLCGSFLIDPPQKRWIDTVNDCLEKRHLEFGQGRRIGMNGLSLGRGTPDFDKMPQLWVVTVM